MPGSAIRDRSHMSSFVTFARAQYSASVLERDTVLCFSLVDHDIKLIRAQINTITPVEFQSSRQSANQHMNRLIVL